MPDAPLDPLCAYAAAAGDRAAVIEDGTVTTYAAFNAEVNRLVDGLAGLGATSGQRAVWCAPNSRHVLAFMHACRKLGLVAVPMSYRFTAEEMRHVLADSGASLVAVDAAQAPLVAGLVAELREPPEVVVFRGEQPGTHSWDALVAGGVARRAAPARRLRRRHDVHVRHHRPAQGGRAHPVRPGPARRHARRPALRLG